MLDTIDELKDLNDWLQILERIVERSANMVVITDAEQRIRWVNHTYSAVTGWSLDEVRGRRAGELLHGPLTDRRVSQQVRDRLAQGLSVSGAELVNYRKNGEPYTVTLNIEPVRNSRGEVLAYFSSQSDVSEKIEQKRQTNERLQTMVDERTRHLAEANRSLEAFSHALSHDLKKPIRHMVSYAEILQEALASGDLDAARVYGSKIVAAGARMSSLINGMLAFSRLGRRGINPAWVATADLVRDCLAEVAASFPGRRVQASGQDSLPPVWADPVLLREVWINLIDNAVKYSGQRDVTELAFAATASPAGWTLSLRDNGCGFPPERQAGIFQMFGRATPDEGIAGDGIGLALCQRIVQAHGGRIEAASVPGEGSTFSFFLPLEPPGSGFGPP